MKKFSFLLAFTILLINAAYTQSANREKFNSDWKFLLNDDNAATATEAFNDAAWRKLNLPHHWSIKLPFDSTSLTGTGGGALRGGIGCYSKTFLLPYTDQPKNIFIDFDGVYRNGEVFINDHSLGKRPNGYISFRYDLTPYLHWCRMPIIQFSLILKEQALLPVLTMVAKLIYLLLKQIVKKLLTVWRLL